MPMKPREASLGMCKQLITVPDLRQCLIYDLHGKDACLIGVEYMVLKPVYLTLPEEEQKLWHSHEFEVMSGMLILPKVGSVDGVEWEKVELEAMKGVVDLYGKTWHFWQVDKGDELPLGYPTLMGSLTHESQLDIDPVLTEGDETHGVDHKEKAKRRAGIKLSGIPENADSW